jgi:hypothetical protein
MIIKFILLIKSCDIYVHVYSQKVYNLNTFTSENLKIIILYRSMELKIWIKFK